MSNLTLLTQTGWLKSCVCVCFVGDHESAPYAYGMKRKDKKFVAKFANVRTNSGFWSIRIIVGRLGGPTR